MILDGKEGGKSGEMALNRKVPVHSRMGKKRSERDAPIRLEKGDRLSGKRSGGASNTKKEGPSLMPPRLKGKQEERGSPRLCVNDRVDGEGWGVRTMKRKIFRFLSLGKKKGRRTISGGGNRRPTMTVHQGGGLVLLDGEGVRRVNEGDQRAGGKGEKRGWKMGRGLDRLNRDRGKGNLALT